MRNPRFYYEIKPKNPKRLAGQIAELASTNFHTAMLLAEKGRVIEELERCVGAYFREKGELEKMKYFRPLEAEAAKRRKQMLQKLLKRDRARFRKMFMDALDAHNSEPIFAIARAIDGINATNEGDPCRYAILCLKRALDLTNERMTLRQAAEFIGWQQRDKADGLSQFRRICKQLQFPLKRSI